MEQLLLRRPRSRAQKSPYLAGRLRRAGRAPDAGAFRAAARGLHQGQGRPLRARLGLRQRPRALGAARPDRLQFLGDFPAALQKLEIDLQADEKAIGHAEIPGKAQVAVGGYGALAQYDLVDPTRRHAGWGLWNRGRLCRFVAIEPEFCPCCRPERSEGAHRRLQSALRMTEGAPAARAAD